MRYWLMISTANASEIWINQPAFSRRQNLLSPHVTCLSIWMALKSGHVSPWRLDFVIVWVKIVAECRDDVLLEAAVAIQPGRWTYSWQGKTITSPFKISIWMTLGSEAKKKIKEEDCSAWGRIERGSHRGVLRSRVCRYCKNLKIFMACIFFSRTNKKLCEKIIRHIKIKHMEFLSST